MPLQTQTFMSPIHSAVGETAMPIPLVNQSIGPVPGMSSQPTYIGPSNPPTAPPTRPSSPSRLGLSSMLPPQPNPSHPMTNGGMPQYTPQTWELPPVMPTQTENIGPPLTKLVLDRSTASDTPSWTFSSAHPSTPSNCSIGSSLATS